MKNLTLIVAGTAAAGLVAGSTVLAAEVPLVPKIEFKATAHPVKPPQAPQARKPAQPVGSIPAPERPTAAIANGGFGTRSAFTALSAPTPDSGTLSPPVTLTYSGGSPVVQVSSWVFKSDLEKNHVAR